MAFTVVINAHGPSHPSMHLPSQLGNALTNWTIDTILSDSNCGSKCFGTQLKL